jgi:hypothetical protein
VTWKFRGKGQKKRGIPLETYDLGGPMRISHRCELCDLALQMGLSEAEFHRRYDPMEKAQLLATYRSQAKRQLVTVRHPAKE